MTHPDLVPLSAAQQEIMEIVWAHGELTVSDVLAILNKRRKVARNTVLTLMVRMHEKGWLEHRAVGRTYLYRAAVTREATGGQKVRELLEDMFAGSPEKLMTALLDYRGLTKREADRIRKMIDQAQRKKK